MAVVIRVHGGVEERGDSGKYVLAALASKLWTADLQCQGTNVDGGSQ